MISEIWGITPEERTLRRKTSPYAPSDTTPSWMRAPPESLIPITGQPILAARSMILHIFSAMTSPSEPPKTVKSCEKTHTCRPSIFPCPVTTASPQGRLRCMSKSGVQQLLDPLARGELAAVVLLGLGLGRRVHRRLAQLVQLRQALFEGLGIV